MAIWAKLIFIEKPPLFNHARVCVDYTYFSENHISKIVKGLFLEFRLRNTRFRAKPCQAVICSVASNENDPSPKGIDQQVALLAAAQVNSA